MRLWLWLRHAVLVLGVFIFYACPLIRSSFVADNESVALCALATVFGINDQTNYACGADGPLNDPCSPSYWQGVTCVNNSVVGIKWKDFDLRGSIPSEVGYLINLTSMNLGYNTLTSSIPPSIASLTKLSYLDLSLNYLTSSIPSEIGSLQQLQYLDLSYNILVSTISSQIGLLSNLIILDLSENFLTSSIPFLHMSSLSHIVRLSLFDNLLTSSIPSEVGSMSKLFNLDLSENFLTSSIPSEVGLLSNLFSLELTSNLLTSTIPPEIGLLTGLSQLHLNKLALTGSIPESMGAMTVLTLMYLDGNSLTSSIPTSFCDLPLYTAKFDGNQFTCYPSCLTLESFSVDFPHCFGEQDELMCALADLKVSDQLYQIDGDSVLVESSAYSDYQIKYLFLEGAHSLTIDVKTTTIARYILFQCISTFDFDDDADDDDNDYLEDDDITVWPYSGSSFTLNCNYIVIQVIFSDHFHISITPTIDAPGWKCSVNDNGNKYANGLCEQSSEWYGVGCEYGYVAKLDLSALELDGSIPSSLVHLTQLTFLDLSYNNLYGTLPSALVSNKLQYLDLSYNVLSGEVAQDLGHITFLSLSGNLFSGNVPFFHFNDENISKEIKLNGNKFSSMDASICNASYSLNMADNPELCYADCWTTQHVNDVNNCPEDSYFSEDSSFDQILLIILLVLGCILVFMIVLFVYGKHTAAVLDESFIERRNMLKALPIHDALINKPFSVDMFDIITSNLASSKQRDYDGNTCIDIIVAASMDLISADCLYLLVICSLPFDVITGEDLDPSEHEYGWAKLVQSRHNACINVVSRVLEEHKKYAEKLGEVLDANERRCLDIASPECRDIILRKIYLYGRFELFRGPPEHISATCTVIFAFDHGKPKDLKQRETLGNMVEGAKFAPKVALKFMCNFDQFLCELKTHQMANFDDTLVIRVIESFNGKEDPSFYADASLKGFAAYPYCLVMPGADGNYQGVIQQQHIAGENWDAIKYSMKELVSGVQHVHERGYMHGDLKPMNMLVINRDVLLTDFDASAKLEGGYAGAKYSSAYLPPELFIKDASQKVCVRTFERDPHTDLPVVNQGLDYDLVPASASLDMWSMGAILYLLCTGSTMFLSSVEDNILTQEDLTDLMNWSNETKNKKLSYITDKYARSLASMLLTKDPAKRPDCERVLMHPFLTGSVPTRLQGEAPDWDVFISYRVFSDKHHARLLYDKLTNKGLKVWLDSVCLSAGLDWEEGFCKGLISSAFFVTILSREAINSNSIDHIRCNIAKLTPESPCDNVLLEWRLALELKDRGYLAGIFPVMVGDQLPTANNTNAVEYGSYFEELCHPNLQSDVVLADMEIKLRRHLDREGFGLPLEAEVGIRSLLNRITSNQGGFIQGDMQKAFSRVAMSIAGMCVTESSDTVTDKTNVTFSDKVHVEEVVAYKRQIIALQELVAHLQHKNDTDLAAMVTQLQQQQLYSASQNTQTLSSSNEKSDPSVLDTRCAASVHEE